MGTGSKRETADLLKRPELERGPLQPRGGAFGLWLQGWGFDSPHTPCQRAAR